MYYFFSKRGSGLTVKYKNRVYMNEKIKIINDFELKLTLQ